MTTFPQRLRWCIDDREGRTQEKMTREETAVALGVTRAALQNWLRGDTHNLKSANYAAIARFYKVDREWIEHGKGSARDAEREEPADGGASSMRPLLSWEYADELPPGDIVAIPRMAVRLGAGPGKQQPEFELIKDRPQIFAADWIRRMNLKPDALRVMYADGNSMEPRIYDSDALVVDLSQTTIQDGKVYALFYDDGERVKRLSRRPGGGLIIASDNPEHPTISLTAAEACEVRVLGRVVNTSGHRGL